MKVGNVLILLVFALGGALMVGGLFLPTLIGSRPAPIDAPLLQIQGIESALDIFAVDHDERYPTEELGLRALIERPPGDENWKGPYYQGRTTVPIDRWGSPFRYEVKPLDDGRARVRIWSLGADRLPDTGDEIAAQQFFDAVRDFWPVPRPDAGVM